MVPALVYIDNYDEVLDTVEEVKKSLLVALVDRKVTKFCIHRRSGKKD